MDRSLTMTYGAGLVILAMIVGSAWAYLGQRVDGHEDMAMRPEAVEPFAEDGAAVDEPATVAGSSQKETASPRASDAGAQSAPASNAETYVAADMGGAVAVDAAVLTPGSLETDSTLAPLADELSEDEFGILLSFNTHSVNLSAYDFVALTSLRTPQGEVAPVRWVTESDDSHHRSGVIVFASADVPLSQAGDLVLSLRDIDGVPERTLSWALPLG